MAEGIYTLHSLELGATITCFESQVEVEEEETHVERKFIIMSSDMSSLIANKKPEAENLPAKRKRGRPRKQKPDSTAQPQNGRQPVRQSQRKPQNWNPSTCCCNSRDPLYTNRTGASRSERKETECQSKSNKKPQRRPGRPKTSLFDNLQHGFPENQDDQYVEKILGCIEKNGKRYIVIKWKNVDYPTIIEESKTNECTKKLLIFHHLKEITRIRKYLGKRNQQIDLSCGDIGHPVITKSSPQKDYRSEQWKVFEKETLADRRVDIKIENDEN